MIDGLYDALIGLEIYHQVVDLQYCHGAAPSLPYPLASPPAQAWIQDIAERIAQQVKTHHHHKDRQA